MQNQFNSIQLTKPLRSEFDMSNVTRVSARMGKLYPVLMHEAIPTDTWYGSTEVLLRVAPLLAPIFDFIELYVHFFFVPNRLLWDNGRADSWEEFITGGRLGVGVDPLTAPVPPYIEIGDILATDPTAFNKKTLSDYLGIPPLLDIDSTVAHWNGKKLDLMPFLAYDLVWFEYYRDRNFLSDQVFPTSIPVAGGLHSGSNALSFLLLRLRCYQHDYFNSALPFTQRGTEVLVPMEGLATVNYLGNALFTKSDGSALTAGATNFGGANFLRDSANQASKVVNIDSVEFNNTSVSINDFRSAYALQVWLERNAVAGSRYTEALRAHFNAPIQDARLQRPEYLGGGRIQVKISEVVSTAWATNSDDDSVPQANLAGHGITYGNTNQFRYFVPEHGFVIGVLSIMNPPSYHQGLPRMFYRRRSFLGYPWPTFAKLGEQQIDNAELYCTPASITPDADGEFPLFGYTSRYADWKYACNTNRGDFHDTLLFWTLTLTFASTPVLNSIFTGFETSATEDRIFAVGGGIDHFWLFVHNKVTARRPLPYFGTPNTLGFV